MRGARASALGPLPELPAGWRRDAAAVLGVFVLSRLAVGAVFAARGLSFPFLDAGGYVAQAEWIVRHHSLAVPPAQGGRLFSGMPLLLAALSRLTGEFAVTGYVLNLLLGAGAALLFYRHFPRRDWGIFHALLLPGWVSMTSACQSEAVMWALVLLAWAALRLDPGRPLAAALLVLGGYAFACRPPAVLILGPLLAAAWLPGPRRQWGRFWLGGLWLALLPAAWLAWNRIDTGSFLPQSRWQAQEFASWTAYYGGRFPARLLTWPGLSFARGLAAPLSPALKAVNLAHLGAWALALGWSLRAWRRDPGDGVNALLCAELAVNGLFVLATGGAFGFTMYYRYIATQANPFLVLAWLRGSGLRRGGWWLGALASLALACAVARQG